jgi:hypothetical protein
MDPMDIEFWASAAIRHYARAEEIHAALQKPMSLRPEDEVRHLQQSIERDVHLRLAEEAIAMTAALASFTQVAKNALEAGRIAKQHAENA